MITVEKQQPKTYARIRCTNEVYDQVAEIANECDLTLNQVVSSLLLFALNHAKVVSTEKRIVEHRLVIGGEEYGHHD
ncbi:hypothetical protein BVE84_05645 [Streptococcus azizii]|uniref:CopG family transcriptional regulator n=2 Tax=Streptococcus TaxID=1301 RepID=A0AB36JQ72_9STRE|nr:hypothetical protein [Streptococcus sp. LYSM12]MBF0775990.1 hypothetical protein [Streptococcus sp. 19428wD3_AN2]MBF0787997.1 hypothetical protein [Streptococcus sp. 19428wC2_LYSM12]ONK26325.1 hypothetical protein BVE86_07585 [Streptococcus azizii]TFU83829.1 hypothetical protein E4T83_04255 [Streptococcus sp. AN2]ONK28190.1 hypothetical protein BVE85_05080 [Streptococcus azizii]